MSMRAAPAWCATSLVAAMLAACASQPAAPAVSPHLAPAPAGPGTVYRGRFPHLRTVAEHWNLAIDRKDDGTHPAVLRWEVGTRTAEGMIEPVGDAYYAAQYRGTLRIDGVERAATVEVVETPCTDDADTPHALRVELVVESLPPFAPACGDFVLPDPP